MSENTTDPTFTCGGCDYSTAQLKEGMSHAAETAHELTRAIDDEGTTMTISLSLDDEPGDGDFDEDDDWDTEDQW